MENTDRQGFPYTDSVADIATFFSLIEVSPKTPFFSISALGVKINAVLLALLIGYGVGQIFHWLGKEHKPVDFEHAARIKELPGRSCC